MTQPLIGISMSREEKSDSPARDWVRRTYMVAIIEAGGIPVLLPNETSSWELLRHCHGLLLTGGGDFDPATFGAADQGTKMSGVSKARDTTELGLIKVAEELDMPTFGICRGLQALTVAGGGALVQSGAIDAFGLTPREVAMTCASHGGEEQHVELVQGILAKISARQEDLICGVHMPSHRETTERMLAEGRPAEIVHNNCSGKHSGMLTLARMLKAPLEGYQLPEHPVQRKILENVALMTGIHRLVVLSLVYP